MTDVAAARVPAPCEVVIRPRKSWHFIDLPELWAYREVLWLLVWRDLKLRYRQTVLGASWAVLQPALGVAIFTVLLGRVQQPPAAGLPYPLFASVGLAAWTFFSNAVSFSSNSLVANQQLISKIYFPRILIPLSAIGGLLVDFLVSFTLVGTLLLVYRWPVSVNAVWIPVFMAGTVLAASAVGIALSALHVQFRDFKYATPFMLQIGLFLTPVVYPVQYVPEHWQIFMGLNPMAGMVEGLRFAILGGTARWDVVAVSTIVTALLLAAGMAVFQRLERRFADVI